jgi:hypothetical protein
MKVLTAQKNYFRINLEKNLIDNCDRVYKEDLVISKCQINIINASTSLFHFNLYSFTYNATIQTAIEYDNQLNVQIYPESQANNFFRIQESYDSE